MALPCPFCSAAFDPAASACPHCGGRPGADMAGTRTLPPPAPATADATTTGTFRPLPHPDSDPPSSPVTIPETVGGYRLEEELGRGGMGAVFRAVGPDGRRVAIKLLSGPRAPGPADVERFRQEGWLASQISHSACVFVLAADIDPAGIPYIVMELMPGKTLKDLVADGRGLPPEEALARILEVIDGLAEAHKLGMIHRDVKPGNCFLTADGRVKVGDFGLAKILPVADDDPPPQSVTPSSGVRRAVRPAIRNANPDTELTDAPATPAPPSDLTQGRIVGTPLYAPPEQLTGGAVDYRADVYAVCGTLYHLLSGQAPLAGADFHTLMARAERRLPVPPLGSVWPGAPRVLERAVMKGLDADPARRWQTLAGLRAALVSLMPALQKPARPRAVAGAFAFDLLVLAVFVVGPLGAALAFSDLPPGVQEAAAWVAAAAYFAVAEGAFGATVGKLLLGLRVVRLGGIGPPGVGVAAGRAAVFALLGVWLTHAPVEIGEAAGFWAGAGAMAAGLLALAVQTRKAWGFRGLHDFASGCRVVQLPRPAHVPNLVSPHPTPLERPLPAGEPLPAAVGPFAVLYRVRAEASGEQVWLAEDRALGRWVLIALRPEWAAPPPEVARPARLRAVGHGELEWHKGRFKWTAFVAPTGAPVADTIDPANPVRWADARVVLEQLVDELQAASADASLPPRLSPGQVWVEPGGRVQLVDVPLADAPPGTGGRLRLLRQVASLALEGTPRDTPGPVKAPLPPHAAPVMHRLFGAGGDDRQVGGLQHDLADTRELPPAVTPSRRAAHLGLQGLGVGAGLVLMFALTGLAAVRQTVLAEVRAKQAEGLLRDLRDETRAAEMRADPDAVKVMSKYGFDRLEGYAARTRAEADARRAALIGPQRVVLRLADGTPLVAGTLDDATARRLMRWAAATTRLRGSRTDTPFGSETALLWLALGLVPVAFVAAAAGWRGGLAFKLAGIALVRRDGGPATRWQCAVRAAAVWLPVAALLAASGWLQIHRPEYGTAAVVLWLAALALLPVYAGVALRYPDRPPQDRLTDTFLVPA